MELLNQKTETAGVYPFMFGMDTTELKDYYSSEEAKESIQEISEGEDKNIEELYPKEIQEKDYHVDKNGKQFLNSSIDTYRYFLQNDKGLKNIKGLNILSNNVELSGPLPWRPEAKDGDCWQDNDDAMLRGYLFYSYKNEGIKLNNNLSTAFEIETGLKSFNPLQEYLNSLKWDGVNRLDNFLIDWFGAENCDWSKIAFRKTMIAGAARALNPGCKVDTVLSLISTKQGVGKSTLCRMLGKKWFNDSMTTWAGKEAYEALQGNWIIEIPENSVVSRTDINQAKAFISKQEDTYRAAYAHRPITYKRMCIFIITANDKRILKDSTGNRRFLPVDLMVNEPKYDFLHGITEEYIDQLWAEALVAYQSGENWWLNDYETGLAEIAQAEHREEDPRVGIIQDYLETPIPVDWKNFSKKEKKDYFTNYSYRYFCGVTKDREKVCAEEIAEECLGYDLAKTGSYIIEDVKKIMEEMPGWIRQKNPTDYKGYGRRRGWIKDDGLPF